MFEFQITPLDDELTELFEELEMALAQLNGTICELHFDPSKPDQLQAAIQTMERAVDERLSEFPDNPLVQQFATGTKEKIKAEIVKRASEARRQLALNAIPLDPLHTSALIAGKTCTPLNGWNSVRPARRGRM